MKNNAALKWTHCFDAEASRYAGSFSREDITAVMLQNKNWRKDGKKRSYVMSCIKDRIRRGRIRELEDGTYEWIHGQAALANNAE